MPTIELKNIVSAAPSRSALQFGVAALLIVAFIPILAQGQATASIQMVATYASEGQISSVDPSPWTVTVMFPNASIRVHTVSPPGGHSSAVSVGVTVAAAFEDRLIFVLPGANVATPSGSGSSPATVVSSGEALRTHKVERAAGREHLPRVKSGDSLNAINSPALVIAIMPKG